MDGLWLVAFAGGAAIVVREFITAAAVGIAIIGIDDIAVDIVYFSRRLWRWLTVYSRHRRTTADLLVEPETPGSIAILVPAWDEAAVIGEMLKGSLARLRHDDYCLFVGIYPNDPATSAAVAAIADPRIVPVITGRNGPTTKADCLNHLWRAVLDSEHASGKRFKAVALHDAEDIPHSLELRVFDHLIERFDMVQLPVLPLPDPRSRWISGHYLDEFAESHGKDLVVREALGAAVPSAGVGCAISRTMMDQVAALGGGQPFNEHSVTEDYELGLKIGMLGGRGVLVRMPGAPGRMVVATREHFPATLEAAVRQKARWLTGITLHGWDRLGWSGGLAERWMRLRDRKSILAAITTLFAYVGAIGYTLLAIVSFSPLPAIIEPDGWLTALLVVNAFMLAWRLAMRATFTAASYGPLEGLLAVPRAFVANVIAILACFRAIGQVGRSLIKPAPVSWDKTQHKFPVTLPSE